MSILKEFIQESLPQLNAKIMVDTNSLQEFYNSRHDGNFYSEIWNKISDNFAESRLSCFSTYSNPKNKVEELINEFFEAYPELDGEVYFYFSD